MRRVEGFTHVPNETNNDDTEQVPIRVVKSSPRARKAGATGHTVGGEMKERISEPETHVERSKRIVRRKKEVAPEAPVVQEEMPVLRERTAAEEAALRAAVDHALESEQRKQSAERATKEREMLAELIAQQESARQEEEPASEEEEETPHMEAVVGEAMQVGESAEARLAQIFATPEQQYIWKKVRDWSVWRLLKPENYLDTPTHTRLKQYIDELAATTPLPKKKLIGYETVEEYIARATGADLH